MKSCSAAPLHPPTPTCQTANRPGSQPANSQSKGHGLGFSLHKALTHHSCTTMPNQMVSAMPNRMVSTGSLTYSLPCSRTPHRDIHHNDEASRSACHTAISHSSHSRPRQQQRQKNEEAEVLRVTTRRARCRCHKIVIVKQGEGEPDIDVATMIVSHPAPPAYARPPQ